MKYNIINCEEAKRITGWDKDMDHEYRGPISGYYCGYNFEVKKGDITDFASCTFSPLSPEDLMNPEKDWYSQYLQDVGCEPTGRVIFRGYYREDYDEYERDYYYVNAHPFEDEEE